MTIVTTHGPSYEQPIEALLQKARVRIDSAVMEVATHNFQTPTQEHQLTPRIAQTIQEAFRYHPIEVDGLTLKVYTQDVPDRGYGAMESRIGADLYVALDRLDREDPISKGAIIQSKWRGSLVEERERRRLRNQIARMYRRSKTSAYIWVFDDSGVTCVKAPKSSDPTLRWIRNAMTVGDMITEGLRCNLGDKKIGRDLTVDPARGITQVLHRLSVGRGLDFVCTNS